jgi:hypothetical protein
VAIWARDSKILRVKDLWPSGAECTWGTVWRTIKRACPSYEINAAIYSFCIALLPFFNLTPAELTHLSKYNFGVFFAQSEVRESRVFCALAYFVLAIGYLVETHVEEQLKEMAEKFKAMDEYENEVLEAILKPVRHAISQLKPGGIQAPRNEIIKFSEELAKDYVNSLYVEYARKFDADFNVGSIGDNAECIEHGR